MSFLDDKEKDTHSKTINLIKGYSNDRNTLAHNLFADAEDHDGVSFHVVWAKGEVKFPQYEWTVAKFEEAYINLHETWSSVKKIGERIKEIDTSLAALMAASPPSAPSEAPFGIGSLGQVLPQPPEDHASSNRPANSETNDQMPPDLKS